MFCRQPAAVRQTAAARARAAQRPGVETPGCSGFRPSGEGRRAPAGRDDLQPGVSTPGRACNFDSVCNVGYLARVEVQEEAPGRVVIELRIARLDHQEVAVARRESETRHVE